MALVACDDNSNIGTCTSVCVEGTCPVQAVSAGSITTDAMSPGSYCLCIHVDDSQVGVLGADFVAATGQLLVVSTPSPPPSPSPPSPPPPPPPCASSQQWELSTSEEHSWIDIWPALAEALAARLDEVEESQLQLSSDAAASPSRKVEFVVCGRDADGGREDWLSAIKASEQIQRLFEAAGGQPLAFAMGGKGEDNEHTGSSVGSGEGSGGEGGDGPVSVEVEHAEWHEPEWLYLELHAVPSPRPPSSRPRRHLLTRAHPSVCAAPSTYPRRTSSSGSHWPSCFALP